MLKEKEKQGNDVAVDLGEEQLMNDQTAEKRPVERHGSRNEADFAPLFEQHEAEQFRTHWLEIQSRFVDDPNVSVKDADELVANVIRNITRTFADKRMTLENQWKRGDKVSTEDLRVALKRYRSFFDRLLSLES
jgi:hypothetical protein